MKLLLNRGELLDLGENLKGMSVICHSGSCWLTQAGDSRDYILRSHAELELQSKGQIVVSATSCCRLELLSSKECRQASLQPGLLFCNK